MFVKKVLYKTFVDLIAFYLYVMVYEWYKYILYDVGKYLLDYQINNISDNDDDSFIDDVDGY